MEQKSVTGWLKSGVLKESLDLYEFYEFLIDSKVVHRDPKVNKHRWHSTQKIVVEVDGRFVEISEFTAHENQDFYYLAQVAMEDVAFVERKERVITEVYYE